MNTFPLSLVVLVIFLVWLANSVNVLREYERGVIFRHLFHDVAGAHRSILKIGAGFPHEVQRIFEIESDNGIARELQKEIAQRTDRNRPGHVALFCGLS